MVVERKKKHIWQNAEKISKILLKKEKIYLTSGYFSLIIDRYAREGCYTPGGVYKLR